MTELTMLQKVKLALRITHTSLDDELTANINAAYKELERVGVNHWSSDDVLIIEAVKTFCKAKNTENQNDADKYMESFRLQADELRKTGEYRHV